MSLLAAARLNDPIAHSSMFAMIGKIGAGLLVGALVGAAVGFMATALVAGTVLSGGLVGAVAVTLISRVRHFHPIFSIFEQRRSYKSIT